MQIFIVTHSSTYDCRAEAAGEYFIKKGNTVQYIFSDFDHLRRARRGISGTVGKTDSGSAVYLPMRPYRKNLSARRLLSIRRFAGDVKKYLDGQLGTLQKTRGAVWVAENVLVWFLVPANSFVRAASVLKKRYGVRIVLDLIDLWPESIPRPELQKLPPMRVWASLRDRYLDCADWIFTECSLYQKILDLPEKKTTVLPWFKDEPEGREKTGSSATGSASVGRQDKQPLQIVYLGAVNHIIDIELITEFLRRVKEFLGRENRELLLHLIGEGEHKQDFLRSLAEGEIPFRDYGAVYEEEQKKSILQPCSFGLNFMKSSVRVGLTMKSIDYLSFGIPILNTIPDDTWELVDREKIGVNVDRDHLETAVQAVAEISGDPEEWQAMHVRARETFEKNFTRQAFWQVLDRVDGGWADAQNGASPLRESACRQADAKCLQADTDAEKRLLSSSEKDKQ